MLLENQVLASVSGQRPTACYLSTAGGRQRAVLPDASTASHMRIQRCNPHRPLLLTGPSTRQPVLRRRLICAAGVPPALAHAAVNNLAGLLMGGGLVLLGLAACVFCITAIPTIREARRALVEFRAVLRTLDQELPDTAAAMRLSGLEMADAIEEVSLLGCAGEACLTALILGRNDLSQGVRAAVALVAGTQGNVQAGAELAGAAVTSLLLPALRERLPAARSVVEAKLQERAAMQHRGPTLAQAAAGTKQAAQRIRASLAAADLVSLAGRAARTARALRVPARPSAT